MTIDEWSVQEKSRITVFVRYRKTMGVKPQDQESEGYWAWSFNEHKKRAARIAQEQDRMVPRMSTDDRIDAEHLAAEARERYDEAHNVKDGEPL